MNICRYAPECAISARPLVQLPKDSGQRRGFLKFSGKKVPRRKAKGRKHAMNRCSYFRNKKSTEQWKNGRMILNLKVGIPKIHGLRRVHSTNKRQTCFQDTWEAQSVKTEKPILTLYFQSTQNILQRYPNVTTASQCFQDTKAKK